jgi:transposase-like protein
MYNKHLSDRKIAAITRCFCGDLTATATAPLVGISRNTVNSYFNEIRQRVFRLSLQENNQELGVCELDESYFGAKRVRGKRGRGATGKTPVFGLLKRSGKVFVTVVPNCSKDALIFRDES